MCWSQRILLSYLLQMHNLRRADQHIQLYLVNRLTTRHKMAGSIHVCAQVGIKHKPRGAPTACFYIGIRCDFRRKMIWVKRHALSDRHSQINKQANPPLTLLYLLGTMTDFLHGVKGDANMFTTRAAHQTDYADTFF